MQRRMCRCFTFFSRIWTKVILLWIKLKLKESWKPKFGEDFSLNLKKCLKPVKACDTSPVCQTLKVKLRLFIKFPTSVQRWKTWDTIKRFPTHCRKFQPFSIFHTWINDSESPCLSGHMDNNVETVVFESVLSGTYILTTALIPALKKASDPRVVRVVLIIMTECVHFIQNLRPVSLSSSLRSPCRQAACSLRN